VTLIATAYRFRPVSRCSFAEINSARSTTSKGRLETGMGILWIILIVVLVLALLGFFSRGYW
jgi:flagellar basal body-associated protein FliL